MTPISASAPSNATAASGQLQVDYQNFLKLLTAQISNQDPLAPMESTEFVSQLAQLSQVEQSIQTNTNLEAISASMAAATSFADLGLLGREVTVPAGHVVLENGRAGIGYELGAEATAVEIRIEDADGTVLRRIAGAPGTAGTRQETVWNGLGDGGQPLEDGTYRLTVAASDAAGAPVAVTALARTRVDSVSFDGSGSRLMLANGETAAAGSVVAVR